MITVNGVWVAPPRQDVDRPIGWDAAGRAGDRGGQIQAQGFSNLMPADQGRSPRPRDGARPSPQRRMQQYREGLSNADDDESVISENSRQDRMRFYHVAKLASVLLELGVVGPTIEMELGVYQGAGPIVLRILLFLFRILPFFASFRCVADRLRWVESPLAARGCHWLKLLTCGILHYLHAKEARMCLTAGLGIWYLVSTPLNRSLRDMRQTTVLVANVSLCLFDTLSFVTWVSSRRAAVHQVVVVAPVPLTPAQVEPLQPKPVTLGATGENAVRESSCMICLVDFVEADQLSELPCGHAFHSTCITQWLQRSQICPLRCGVPAAAAP